MHRDIRRLRNVGIYSHDRRVTPHPPRGVLWTPSFGSLAAETHALTLVELPQGKASSAEWERALRAVDGVIVMVDASTPTPPATVLSRIRKHDVACVVAVSGLDEVGADFDARVSELEAALGSSAVVLQRPYTDEKGVHVVDVIEQRLVVAIDDGLRRKLVPLPKSLHASIDLERRRIVDICAEADDAIMGASSVGMDVGADELQRALRKKLSVKTVYDARISAVVCGSNLDAILDAATNLLPSPADRPPVRGVDPKRGTAVARFPREDDALAAVAFAEKDPSVEAPAGLSSTSERAVWVRVYSGTLTANAVTWSFAPGLGAPAKIQVDKLLVPVSGDLVEVDEACAGSIVLAHVRGVVVLGETFTDPRAPVELWCARAPERAAEATIER